MIWDFRGRVAVVTGAAQGIGRALAIGMAGELRALGVRRRALLASWNGHLALSMTAPTPLLGNRKRGRKYA